ncbi:sulfotransferase [Aureisphaera sp. CAU 1614]|uniref:Sulfotransferase n=1 Tax=Halomarinibacterium sedimenti TaxID=2857106 RepID=A0A9X1FPY6_9FLAO|nr:sulfotransferase [Halomarinibacterium sedimenti]MBW2937722.1 sulfotransferase [Halomarinibacterium sedimenti]
MRKKNILVTGSHRSGSTWLGKVITSSSDYVYVDEPFNIGKNHKSSPFKNQFEYLPGKSVAFQNKAKKYLNSFNSLFANTTFDKLIYIKSRKDIRKFLSEVKSRTTRGYVYKDPLALMSAEWIYKNYGWDIVVLIRHPAAFVASLKVKNWQFYFKYFSEQEMLINTHLQAYSKTITEYTNNRPDILKQGILLWNILYSMVCYLQEKYKEEWYFVKHEDLSLQPMEEFEKLYNFLKIEMDDRVKDYILETTSSKEQTLLKRDSKKNISSWKNRLSLQEIQEIKEGTKEVWKHFYSDEDW